MNMIGGTIKMTYYKIRLHIAKYLWRKSGALQRYFGRQVIKYNKLIFKY